MENNIQCMQLRQFRNHIESIDKQYKHYTRFSKTSIYYQLHVRVCGNLVLDINILAVLYMEALVRSSMF